MEIIWTDEAQEELLAVTRYYLDCAGERVADKMFRTITDMVSRLSFFPFMGQRVAGYGGLYRSIVAHPHYKVIYRVEDDKVDTVIGIIAKYSSRRTQIVPSTSTMEVGMYSSFPVEVTVGGSTIFVLNVDRFEKV